METVWKREGRWLDEASLTWTAAVSSSQDADWSEPMLVNLNPDEMDSRESSCLAWWTFKDTQFVPDCKLYKSATIMFLENIT